MDEQLKEIQELEGYGGIGGYAVYFENKKQFEWLKEQAEKVPELEEKNHLYKLRKENAQELNEIVIKPLQEENQRYKEALEFYAEEDNHVAPFLFTQDNGIPVHNESKVDEDKGVKARQALRGEY